MKGLFDANQHLILIVVPIITHKKIKNNHEVNITGTKYAKINSYIKQRGFYQYLSVQEKIY